MMPLRFKLALAQGSKFGTKEQIRQTSTFFSSESERPGALIFGMYHLIVNVYQVWSYDAQEVKTGPALGGSEVRT